MLPNYQQDICTWLENKLHSDIKLESFSLDWNGGYPSLKIDKLKLTGKKSTTSALTADEIKLELDLYKLFVSYKFVYKSASIKNMVVNLENTDANSWSLLGVASVSRSWHSKSNLYYPYFITQILNSKILVNDVFINLYTKSEVYNIKIPQILVDKNKSGKILQSCLYINGRTVEISGNSTVTNKGESWQGKLKVSDIIIENLTNFIDKDISVVKNCSASIDSIWHADGKFVTANGLLHLKSITNNDALDITSDFIYQSSAIDAFNLRLKDICYNRKGSPKCELSADIFISDKLVNKKYFICSASNFHLAKVAEITQHFLKPENDYSKIIRQLSPKGSLDNFYLKYNLSTVSKNHKLDITANLNNVSIMSTKGVPKLINVSGILYATENKGVFHMNSANFGIHIPDIYSETMHYNLASSTTKWNINQDYVNLYMENINLMGGKDYIKGLLKLDIPTKDTAKHPHLSLLLSAKDTTLDILPKYLPKDPIVSSGLNSWLNNALHNAQINQITYLFNGYLQRQNNSNKYNQNRLFCLFDNLTLDILDNSYSITNAKGKLILDNTKVDITTSSAKLLESDIQYLETSITLSDNSKLSAHAVVQSKNGQIKDLLMHIPNNKKFISVLHSTQFEGLVNSKVDVYLPLQQDNFIPVVDVHSEITNVNVVNTANKIKFNTLNGSFHYNSLTGLNTDFITGYLFNEKNTFEVKTTLDATTNQIKTISGICNGSIAFKNISELINYPIDNLLSGKMRHRSTLDFYPLTDESYFTLESNLEGVSSNLPRPFYKDDSSSLPVHLRYYMKNNTHKQVKIELENNNTININIKHPYITAKQTNNNKSYILDGNISMVDAKEWLDFFSQYPKTEQSTNVELDSVLIKELTYENFKLNSVEVKSNYNKGNHNLQITSDKLAGILEIPQDSNSPINIDFTKINLDNNTEETSSSFSLLKDKITNLNWQELPTLNVKIDYLNYNSIEINKTNFTAHFTEKSINIVDLKTHLEDTEVQLFADWQKEDGTDKCWVQGDIIATSKNSYLNYLLKQRGVITASKASISFAVGWDDSPFNLKKNKLYGSVSTILEDGNINKIEKNAKVLKPLGLFNADSLVKRLRLDFSDLFSSGYSYDSIKGNCLLSYGKIYTDDYIIIVAPSATQKLSGMVDINSNKLELDLVITLPIVSNLPIISLFLAANPILSGLIFIADKAIGTKINALANINYRIYGDTDNPKIVLKKFK